LKRMFSLAIESAKLLHRPHIPMLKEDNVRAGFFEAEQFESVKRQLPEYLRPLVGFMYITGWRRNEVTSLEWRQVDFGAGTITLDPGMTKNDEGRVFPMTAALRTLLKDQHAIRCAARQGEPPRRWVPRPRPEACHLFCESNALTDRAGGSIAVLRRAAGSRQTPSGEDPSDDRDGGERPGRAPEKMRHVGNNRPPVTVLEAGTSDRIGAGLTTRE